MASIINPVVTMNPTICFMHTAIHNLYHPHITTAPVYMYMYETPTHTQSQPQMLSFRMTAFHRLSVINVSENCLPMKANNVTYTYTLMTKTQHTIAYY